MRTRLILFFAAATVAVLGMAAKYSGVVFWRDYGGGALYVVFWSLVLAAARPRLGAGAAALAVFAATSILEFLQLVNPAWLAAVRATWLGRALIGSSFDWLDFPAYAAGGILAWIALRLMKRLTAAAAAPPVENPRRGSPQPKDLSPQGR